MLSTTIFHIPIQAQYTQLNCLNASRYFKMDIICNNTENKMSGLHELISYEVMNKKSSKKNSGYWYCGEKD